METPKITSNVHFELLVKNYGLIFWNKYQRTEAKNNDDPKKNVTTIRKVSVSKSSSRNFRFRPFLSKKYC